MSQPDPPRPKDLPELEQDREALREAELPAPMLDAMYEELARRTLDAQPGWRERLQALATPVRALLGLLGVVAMGATLLALQGPREDLDMSGWMRLGPALLGMGGLAVVAVLVSLRGLHRRPPGAVGALLAGLLLCTPLIGALIPGLWEGLTLPAEHAMGVHRACFSGATITAALCTTVLLLLQRYDSPPLARIMSSAGAGGLIGFVVQQAHCPYSDPLHLLLAHGLAGLVVAAVVATGLRAGEALGD